MGSRACVLLLALILGCVQPSAGRPASRPQGAVATVHPIATDLARSFLERGGNAVDAAVVAGLTLGVVDGHNSGIGGGCFLLIRQPSGRFVALDGRETAPKAASREMFLRQEAAIPRMSQTGALAVGVPGALAAYQHAVEHYGRIPFREHLRAAAEIAERGFAIRPDYAARIRSEMEDLRGDPGCRALLFHPDGFPLGVGDMLIQPDLAQSYRLIAGQGTRWMYGGGFSTALEDWMRDRGGLMGGADLEGYRVRLREPLRSRYRGFEIVGFPPPSSGGVHVAQILNILEHFDLRAMGRRSAAFVHVVTEAMKLAFADRAYWLGDPDHARVPRGLAATSYAKGLARRIKADQAVPVEGPGRPDDAAINWFGKHTTHFTTADSAGGWVACTSTINTSFGAKAMVPGTGIFLNNQMDDFSTAPGMANFFGLVGGEANAVAPGKRPLSSMSPTIVLREGRPVLTVGAAGGPTIISQSVLTILGVVDFGLSAAEALAEPRFHHQWRPDELRIESGFDAGVMDDLGRRGHRVVAAPSIGACQAIEQVSGRLKAAHDPRVQGKSVAW